MAGAIAIAAVMLTAVFSVDPAYYYPRMITDQLLYYMKGLSFIEDGTTAARFATNAQPFTYAALPGLLRAPFMAVFSDFDDQLRAIQIANIGLGIVLAAAFSYVLAGVLPRRFRWIGIAYAFVTLLLNPVWVTNMLSPLADLPYAVASICAVIILNRLIAGTERERRSLGLKVAFIVLFAVAFGCRYTAPVILLYGWMLHRQRNRGGASRLLSRRAALGLSLILTVLLAVNARTIIVGYLWQPASIAVNVDPLLLILNTLAVGGASQLIPGFELLFRNPPVIARSYQQLAGNPFDLGLVILGMALSGIVVYGMWRSRKMPLRPELVYVLAPLPILAAMMPGTARYMLSYQPFIWIFFCIGAAGILKKKVPAFRWRRGTIVTSGLVACAGVVVLLYIRSGRLNRGEKTGLSTFSIGATRRHAADVAITYRSLRNFLATLPRRQSTLLGQYGSAGQWKVIAGIDYYLPDTATEVFVKNHDVYIVADCPTKELCSGLEGAISHHQRQMLRYGKFEYHQVFATGNDYSAARVYRLRVPD